MANFYNLSAGGCQTGSRPIAPTGFACTQTDNTTMQLDWDETDSDFDWYSIERSLVETSGFVQVYQGVPTAPLAPVTFTDSGLLVKNTRYYYKFRALKGTKWSDYQVDDMITTNV